MTPWTGPVSAAHMQAMGTKWMLAPARLAPDTQLPRPVKYVPSPGYPTTAADARAFAREIKADRAHNVPWREIADRLSITRIEAIRLAHDLPGVLAEIKATDH